MDSKQAIEHIEDDLVCANACPQYNRAGYYDIEKCTCYKKKVIRFIQSISETTIFVVELKDPDNPGCVLNRYIGDCGEGTMGMNVEFNRAYKFYDRESAVAFLEHCGVAFAREYINPDEYVITEHGMVS